jgi:hypothetical protein
MLHAFIELDAAYLFVPTHTDPAIFYSACRADHFYSSMMNRIAWWDW